MSSKTIVLITGALTGIGRATAVAFANDGASLVVSGRREEVGQALAAELRGLGAEVEFIKADVRREEAVRDLVDRTVERFGRLDVVVNSAGTEGSARSRRRSDRGQLCRHIRHQCPGHRHGHEACDARDAPAGAGQHRQCVLDDGPQGCRRRLDLHGQQARGGGPDEGGGAGGRRLRRARQCRCAGSGGDRHAEPIYRQRGTQGRTNRRRSDAARRPARGGRAGDRFPCLGQGELHHRPDPVGRRRQVRHLIPLFESQRHE